MLYTENGRILQYLKLKYINNGLNMDTQKRIKSTIKPQKPTTISPYNGQHIGLREEQQDSFTYSDVFDSAEREKYGAVAILADGMGGMENGKRASETASQVFLEAYKSSVDEFCDIKSQLLYAVNEANEAVKKIDGAGTTLCAVVIKDWLLHWVSVGDSRIYLYRNGTLRQLNYEHNYEKVLSDMVQSGQISLQQALNDPQRNALTSYIGMESLEEADISTHNFPLFKGDSIMLCSDGLYRALSDDEMAYIIKNANDSVCDVLVEKALEKNISSQDNITVMLMDID